jgi:hypothetical protein
MPLGQSNGADREFAIRFADVGGERLAALFTSVLRDFYKDRGSAAQPGVRTDKTVKTRGAEGVA